MTVTENLGSPSQIFDQEQINYSLLLMSSPKAQFVEQASPDLESSFERLIYKL